MLIAISLWIVVTVDGAILGRIANALFIFYDFLLLLRPDVSFRMVVRMLKKKLSLSPVVAKEVDSAVFEVRTRGLFRLKA